jgi:hypothetical protein
VAVVVAVAVAVAAARAVVVAGTRLAVLGYEVCIRKTTFDFSHLIAEIRSDKT